jgi:hypothetical protein
VCPIDHHKNLQKKDGFQSIHSVHYIVQSFHSCPFQLVSMVSSPFPYQLGVACRFGYIPFLICIMVAACYVWVQIIHFMLGYSILRCASAVVANGTVASFSVLYFNGYDLVTCLNPVIR